MNARGKKGREKPNQRCLDMIQNSMRAAGAWVGLWKIETRKGIAQGWPTPNGWE